VCSLYYVRWIPDVGTYLRFAWVLYHLWIYGTVYLYRQNWLHVRVSA